MGNTPVEDETIGSLVWAVSRYGHDVLGIEPRLDIAAHLLQSARNEPALHVLKAYYRDHFFHSLEVCFLGQMLLEDVPVGGRRLIDVVRELLGLDSAIAVLREWYVAALFHDIGYTIDLILGVEEALKFYCRSAELRHLQDGLGRLIDGLSEDVQANLFQGLRAAEHPGRDHGVVGALHLQSLISHIRKGRPDVHPYDRAVSAIATHNRRGYVPRFSKEPLSVLLVLCDTLQEWNRPRLPHSTAPATMLSRLFFRQAIGDPSDTLAKSSVFLPGHLGPKDSRLEFRLVYGDEINSNSGVFSLWVDTTSNLQRLDLDGLPLDISVSLYTPKFERAGHVEDQMDRLREAADETHMNFLSGWFPSPDNKCVLYDPQARIGVREMEHVRLQVGELTKRRPITASTATFHKLLRRWRRFDEDRSFAGDYAPEPPG